MKKVLFICAGNVARSQIAEAYYNYFTNSSNAISAGVLDYTPSKYGKPIPEVIKVMMEEGIDVSQKKVKTVTKEMVENVNEIYILCPEENVLDFIAESKKITYWDIADPYGSDIENFRSIRNAIKGKIQDIIS